MSSPPVVRAGAGLRLLRAAVFTAVCVVLSAAGHVIASCASVPLWTIGASALIVLAVVAPLAGRERSLPGIVAGLAVGQIALHALFALGQHGAVAQQPPATGMSMADLAARFVCGGTVVSMNAAQAQQIVTNAGLDPTGAHTAMNHTATAGPGAEAAQGQAAMHAGLLPSLPMLLAHLLAAVVIGWLLRRGETALFRLVRLSARGVTEGALVRSLRASLSLVRALLAGLPGAPEQAPRAPHAHLLAPSRPRTEALQHTVTRRGPPAGLALAA